MFRLQRPLEFFIQNFFLHHRSNKREKKFQKVFIDSSEMSHLKRGFYHDSLSQNPKFSHKDWSFNNQLKSRISSDQQKLADRVICEASRVIDETKETTSKFKKETDYRLEERVAHIAFSVDELREQKKFGEREQEILKVFLHHFFTSSLSSIFFYFSTFSYLMY